ncbi:MAG: HD domain-containing protein [Planctomycetota bacterium]
MREYALPSHDECLAMIRDCHVPVHIVKHTEAVAKLGVFLGERLRDRDIDVDVALVERACLLHDLFRVCDCPLEDFSWFEQPVTEDDKVRWRRLKADHGHRRHEDAADAFLKDTYPVLAATIRKHRYTAVIDERDQPESWEEKLVYYADKRAMHERLVPLKDRLDEAHRRSAALLAKAGKPRRIDMEKKVDAQIFRLEEEIFSKIDLDPDEVTDALIDGYRAQSRD